MINKCVYENGIFCSKVHREYLSQIFEIYVVKFLGSIMKSATIIIYILISTNRLNLLNGSRFKFKKLSKTILIFSLGLVLILLNVFVIFTSRVNENFLALDEYSYFEFPLKNTFLNILLYKYAPFINIRALEMKNTQETSYFLLIFQIDFFLNDIFLMAFILFIDLYLLFKLGSALKLKENLHKKNVINLKALNKCDKAKNRIRLVVVCNLSILSLIRVANFVISFYVFLQNVNKSSSVCFHFSKICSNYLEASELLFLLPACYTIITYYCLNKNFRINLIIYLNEIKIKFNSFKIKIREFFL